MGRRNDDRSGNVARRRDLGTFGRPFGSASGINARGQVVGVAGPDAFLWETGVMSTLETLGGTAASASEINDRGQIVGQSQVKGTTAIHAVLWEK